MSHFCVLVFTKDPDVEQLKAALAPFQENNMEDCPEQYLEFHPEDEEARRKEWFEVSIRQLQNQATGETCSPYDEQFRNPAGFLASPQYVVPEGWVEIEVPLSTVYSTFEQFMDDYHGLSQRDPRTGQYGYWENPNKKWDWWVLGGRWQGELRLRPDVDEEEIHALQGEGSTFDRMEGRAPTGWDAARHRDVDWAGMSRECYEQADAQWRRFEMVLEELGTTPDGYLRMVQMQRNPERRELLGLDGEVVRRLHAKLEEAGLRHPFVGEEPEWWRTQLPDLEHLGIATPCVEPRGRREDGTMSSGQWRVETRDEHFARAGYFTTFAVLSSDGQWHERGEMGWFGCVSDEKDRKSWGEEWRDLVSSEDPSSTCWIVDCHI